MKYKGIIFDLDGVIVSTDELHYLAWKMLADKLGVYFDRTVNNRFRGVARMACMEILLENVKKVYSEEDKVALATEKNNYYVESLSALSENDVESDVKMTLEKLRKHGVKIAIGSSSKNAPVILDRIGLREYFDAISDGNNITYSKPNPEVFLKAAEFISLPPKHCLIVEDAFSGIDAGLAGGFDTAGIGDAYRYEKATYKLEKLSDILAINGI